MIDHVPAMASLLRFIDRPLAVGSVPEHIIVSDIPAELLAHCSDDDGQWFETKRWISGRNEARAMDLVTPIVSSRTEALPAMTRLRYAVLDVDYGESFSPPRQVLRGGDAFDELEEDVQALLWHALIKQLEDDPELEDKSFLGAMWWIYSRGGYPVGMAEPWTTPIGSDGPGVMVAWIPGL